MAAIDPWTAGGVLLATAATDAVYVMFTSAVVARKRVPAATWSSVWYLLSSYAVISYTENWVYVAFRGNRLVDWRLCYDHFPAPASPEHPSERTTGRRRAGVMDFANTPLHRHARACPAHPSRKKIHGLPGIGERKRRRSTNGYARQ